MHGAELERLFDDATTSLKNRRIHVKLVELRVTVDKALPTFMSSGDALDIASS